ncbi:hypothetical protein RFI_29194, partial [Reticulomyxa filosa]
MNTFETGLDFYEAAAVHRFETWLQAVYVLLDIPCLLVAIIVYVTIWRASTLHKELWTLTRARDRRRASFLQLLLLFRDLLFVIPFLIIVCTLFRLPMLVLGFMGKMKKPSLAQTTLEVTGCDMIFPEKGKPTFRIKARKPNNFEVPRHSKCSLFVLGKRFWEEVGLRFGGSIATAGQGMLPNTIADKRGMNYEVLNVASNEIEFDVQVQAPQDIKRSAIHNNLKTMSPDVPLCLQLENSEAGILFILILQIRDMVDCAASADGIAHLTNQHFNAGTNRINEVRGTEYSGIVDCFYILVGMEFVKWCIDIFHVCLFFALIAIPWRWIQCVIILLEHPTKWYVRIDNQCIGMMEHAHALFVRLHDFLFEPTLNDLIKDTTLNMNLEGVISQRSNHQSHVINEWCERMRKGFYEFEQELFDDDSNRPVDKLDTTLHIEMNLDTYDYVVKHTAQALSKIKPNPPATAALISDFFQMQMILFWLKCLQTNINMRLLENRISWEHHAMVQEQIHLRQVEFRTRMDGFRM